MEIIPVVIIGAGPIGLVAANLLGKAGIETLVIERNEELCAFPRAIALDDEGLRVCQATGLIDEILAHVRPNVKAYYLSKGHFLAKVAPTVQRNGYPLITTFHQPTFEHILLKGLERFPRVNVLFQHTLEAFQQDEHGVCISVRTPEGSLVQMACNYLLACDGGKSSVRHMLTIPMRAPAFSSTKKSARQTDRGQKWLVVDGIGASEPSDTILFFCDPARPAVSVPGPGQQRRWEFMLLPDESEDEMLQIGTIQRLIQEARRSIPHGFYTSNISIDDPLQIVRQTIYTFHALIATKFVHGRIFLLGDAAHLMPPFGGQGMNSGLRDAHNICWKLQIALTQYRRVPPLRGPASPTNPVSPTPSASPINTVPPTHPVHEKGVAGGMRAPARGAPCEMFTSPVFEDMWAQGCEGMFALSEFEGMKARLLASYHVERYAHSRQMIVFSALLGAFIMTKRRSIALLRNLLLQGIINRIAFMREGLTEMRVKPQPRYTHGFLLKGRSREAKALVGSIVPQPYVLTADSELVRFDEVLGDGFAFVSLHKVPQEVCMGVRIYPLSVGTYIYEQPIDVMDIEQKISVFMNYRCDVNILMRPDRYVMGVFKK